MMFPFSHGGFRHRWHSCVAARERHILWLYDILQISDTQICNPNSDQISQVYIYSMTHFVSVRLCITIHIMCAQKLECIPILGDVINPRPVVPHKAVAEVSKKRKPIGEVSCCDAWMAERIHWWMERWLELCFSECLQWLQWSPHPQLLDVVCCSSAVVVVVE